MNFLTGFKAAPMVIATVVAALAGCAAMGEDEAFEAAGAAQASPLCGNGVRDPGEQCDDGNTSSFDGCDKACAFEQVQRMNTIEMTFTKDALCTSNALGGAVGSVARGQIKTALADAVGSGSVAILLPFLGLTDLTGKTDASFKVASMTGSLAKGAAGAKVGLDASYTPSDSSLDATREPTRLLPATLKDGALSVGPGNLAFALQLGAAPADVLLSNARLVAKVGTANAPGGHAAGEHLDPTLTTFQSMTGGKLCGNISAATLAAIPAPPELQGTACNQGYTKTSTILDVFIGGCTVLFVDALIATQPDTTDSGAPAGGAGAPYRLTAGAGRKVTTCKDKAGVAVPLATCLASAAYSSAFAFTTERVAVRAAAGNAPAPTPPKTDQDAATP